jgi:hypothetical protein
MKGWKWMMNWKDLEGSGRCLTLMHYPAIRLGLSKTKKTLGAHRLRAEIWTGTKECWPFDCDFSNVRLHTVDNLRVAMSQSVLFPSILPNKILYAFSFLNSTFRKLSFRRGSREQAVQWVQLRRKLPPLLPDATDPVSSFQNVDNGWCQETNNHIFQPDRHLIFLYRRENSWSCYCQFRRIG